MLDKNDIQQIRQEIKEVFNQSLEKFAITTLSRTFQDLEDKMATKDDLHELRIELKRDGQNTRDYVDKRISELEGKITGPAKNLREKSHLTVDLLTEHKVFTNEEAQKVKQIPLFEQA